MDTSACWFLQSLTCTYEQQFLLGLQSKKQTRIRTPQGTLDHMVGGLARTNVSEVRSTWDVLGALVPSKNKMQLTAALQHILVQMPYVVVHFRLDVFTEEGFAPNLHDMVVCVEVKADLERSSVCSVDKYVVQLTPDSLRHQVHRMTFLMPQHLDDTHTVPCLQYLRKSRQTEHTIGAARTISISFAVEGRTRTLRTRPRVSFMIPLNYAGEPAPSVIGEV